MLLDALLSLGADVPAPLRRLGLPGYAARLWSRAHRCRAAWAEHEAACHRVVREAVADLPRRRTALVLGSGLVRDVPIDEMATAFERVVLVDAVHLPLVRRRLRHHANLVFDTRDLSGVASWLTGQEPGRTPPLRDLAADERVDYVVSANLLSQLPLPVERFLEARGAPAGDLAGLPDALVRAHLDDLAEFRGRVTLLTDVAYRETDRAGRITDEEDLLRGVILPPADAEWDWTVAPRGEAGWGATRVHRVRAYRDLAAAMTRAGLARF